MRTHKYPRYAGAAHPQGRRDIHASTRAQKANIVVEAGIATLCVFAFVVVTLTQSARKWAISGSYRRHSFADEWNGNSWTGTCSIKWQKFDVQLQHPSCPLSDL